jgi:NADH:ubiquinone oxidoreductase subunit B-like Fe-S oxidoreductase
MRLLSILLILFITLIGCTETPEVSATQSIVAQNQIASNKNEAKQAQEEYLKLQKQRQND